MTKPLKVLDCFSGIGGFALAESFYEGQFETKQFVEINPYCQQVLSKNFKGVPIHEDIKTFTAPRGSFQVCTFGFPCQDISVAGSQSGIGEGTRSGLFYECIRLLREIRPQFAIFENVRNLLSIEEGRVFQEVLFQIAKAGNYEIEWAVVSAKDLGACHLRQRLWILAYSDSIGRGGGNSKRCSIQERSFLSGEQERREMGSETEGCSNTTSNSNDDGSFTSTRIRINGKTNSDTQKGEKKISKSQRSSKPRDSGIIQQTPKWRDTECKLNPNWERYVSEPRLLRGDDGLSNRVDRIKALGNSIVPNCSAIPLQRIKDLIKEKC